MVATDTLTKINSNQDFLDITIHSLDLSKSLYRGVLVNRFSGKEYREITVVCQGGLQRIPFQNGILLFHILMTKRFTKGLKQSPANDHILNFSSAV
jgi:hypothetical protein